MARGVTAEATGAVEDTDWAASGAHVSGVPLVVTLTGGNRNDVTQGLLPVDARTATRGHGRGRRPAGQTPSLLHQSAEPLSERSLDIHKGLSFQPAYDHR